VAQRSKLTWTRAFLACTLLAAGIASLGTWIRQPGFTAVSGPDLVSIPVNSLAKPGVRFYSYRDRAGAELRFILARDSHGGVHAVMDACERCYGYHKGYAASHGYLVCKLCGNRYKLEAMESGLASCVPVRLPTKLVGQSVRIKSADLEQHRGLF
jgi:uncharacterized membrane protein